MGNSARDAGRGRNDLWVGGFFWWVFYGKDGVGRGDADGEEWVNERGMRGEGRLACILVVRAFLVRAPVSAEGCGWVESSRAPLVIYRS